MSPRDEAATLAGLLALLPTGWAWDAAPDGDLARLLTPLARRHAAIEGEADALALEVDPRAAKTLLADYEALLGPDACGRDVRLLRLEERQRIAHSRWVAVGQPTPTFFVQLAAGLGVTARVEERAPSRCGAVRCGARLVPPEGVFAWRIVLPLEQVRRPRCGTARCGARLGAIAPAGIECDLAAWSPAHTTLVFGYEGS